MTSTLHRRHALAALAGVGLAAPSVVRAQAWPEGRTITMLVPFPPGGGTDVISRLVADRLATTMRARIVVENRPGGGGSIGYLAAIKAAPDGGTIMITSSAISTMPFLYPTRGYEPLRDLSPVSLVGSGPSLLCVGPSVKAPDLAAFVAEARKRPGELTYASAGIGSGLHLSAELFKKMAGVDIRHVPYKGASLATGDLLGGRIDMIVDNLSSVRALVDDGKLRALGITTTRRSPLAPTVPPIGETVPGYDYTAWFGLYLPTKVPPDMVATLNRALATALADRELGEKAAVLGIELGGSTPEAFASFMAADMERWGRLVRELGISADG